MSEQHHPSQYAVYLENVEKKFNGVTAIHKVTMGFRKCRITGLIGCNGSGKTVLMKMICGLMRPSNGRIAVMGDIITLNQRSRTAIGAIIENPGFLPDLSGYKNLKLLASLKRIATDKSIREALEIVGLTNEAGKRVGKYSLGMKQRLGIAQSIMEKQEVILLDEPMNALDKHGVADMRKLFSDLRDCGKTIILASHNALDIDVLCDDVYEIENGKIVEIRISK